jgi:hypothetical protein
MRQLTGDAPIRHRTAANQETEIECDTLYPEPIFKSVKAPPAATGDREGPSRVSLESRKATISRSSLNPARLFQESKADALNNKREFKASQGVCYREISVDLCGRHRMCHE